MQRGIQKAWYAIIARCYDPEDRRYRWYGAQGIGVVPEWRESWTEFLVWSLTKGKWQPHYEIHRKNHHEDYGPTNCIWLSKEAHRVETVKERRRRPSR